MTDQLVKDNERIDDLQNGYYVIQDPDKFCFGMDAVLLSGFAKVKKGETALDLGTGTGIIPNSLNAVSLSSAASSSSAIFSISAPPSKMTAKK